MTRTKNEVDFLRNRLNIEGATERIDPDREPTGIKSIHLKRYEFSKAYCSGKKVLDAACGVGYGSVGLSQTAANVTGIDIDPQVIAYARNRYPAENIRFLIMDVTKTDFEDSEFQTICSFETIEHLPNIPAYLEEMVRVLSTDGTYLVSTPHVQRTNGYPENPYHTIEYSRADFESLLHQYFGSVEIYGQRRKQSGLHYYITRLLNYAGLRSQIPRLGRLRDLVNQTLQTTTFDAMSLEDMIITNEKIERSDTLIAVCKYPKKAAL